MQRQILGTRFNLAGDLYKRTYQQPALKFGNFGTLALVFVSIPSMVAADQIKLSNPFKLITSVGSNVEQQKIISVFIHQRQRLQLLTAQISYIHQC